VDLADTEALKAAIMEANPAIGAFLSLENVLADLSQMTEFEFRRYHLNQWVNAPEQWLPPNRWAALAVDRPPPPDGTPVVLGFDGSYSRDSTAIVGATLEERPHIFVVGAWERGDDPSWHVDVLDVEAAIQEACRRWQVRRIGCDPPLWQRSMKVLEEAGLPVIAWPSHQAAHMVPACAQFYDAVMNGGLTHDGDPRLARHIANARVKIDSRGARITKDHKDSVHHIDLAVAAVIALDLAIRERTGGGWRPL
jgi:phage terminase large subunit-like protein